MKVFQFLLFLAALTRANSNLVFKRHVFVNTPLTWSGAREHCQKNYVDMSIIDTAEEYIRFAFQIGGNYTSRGWIGLSKNSTEGRYTKWYDGTVLSFKRWIIEPINKYTENCITTQAGIWSDYSCDGSMPFFCYSEVVLVEELRTWDEALEHCRTYYTDLFSFTTWSDQDVVDNSKVNATTSGFWTGLHYLNGLWIWVNKKPAENYSSLPPCPNQPFSCGAKVGALALENRDCREKMYFACLRQGGK